VPSPFPGMDPYLEQSGIWPGFHGQALSAIVAQLVPQVTPAYVVQMEEQLFIHELPAKERWQVGRGDVTVGSGPRPDAPSRATSGLRSAPIEVRLTAVDVQRQRYIEIRDRRNRSLVTVIEFLSPSNKRSGPDREQYLTKRGEILASPAHLVEIDLLRCQTPLPTESPRPDCTYSVLVSRSERRPSAEFWSIGLRDRLPVIPVPLRRGEPDATLDLQAVLDRVYDEGGFAYLIDDGVPDPPLDHEDSVWAQELSRTRAT
jgi:Protein of unknown function (DUF4058)